MQRAKDKIKSIALLSCFQSTLYLILNSRLGNKYLYIVLQLERFFCYRSCLRLFMPCHATYCISILQITCQNSTGMSTIKNSRKKKASFSKVNFISIPGILGVFFSNSLFSLIHYVYGSKKLKKKTQKNQINLI